MTEAISITSGSIKSLANIDDIRECWQKLNEEEARIDTSLDRILSQKDVLYDKLQTLDTLRPDLEVLCTDASRIFDTIQRTSHLAENINDKIRTLDQEKSRVKHAIQYVDDVQELKRCVEGIQEAMRSKAYHEAAQALQKARRIDPDILNGSLAEFTVPTSDTPDHPSETLGNTKKTLFDMFSQHFDDAVVQRNEADITQYFKLFPIIGCQTEGLDKYIRYVCNTIKAQCAEEFKTDSRLGRYYFANLLKSLIEKIATIIDGHQPLVERYYGKGKMLRVIQSLQEVCDSQSEDVLNRFIQTRSLESKLVEIHASSRSNNLLPASPSNTGAEHLLDPELLHANRLELAEIIRQSALFHRFMHERANEEAQYLSKSEIVPDEMNKRRLSEVNGLLLSSGLDRRIEELLRSYRVIDEYLLNNELLVATQRLIKNIGVTARSPDKQFAKNVEGVDDVFFIIKSAMEFNMKVYHPETVASTTKAVLKHIDKIYITQLLRVADSSMTCIRKNIQRTESVISYVVVLNSLRISVEHVQKITEKLRTSLDAGKLWEDDEIYIEAISRIIEELQDSSSKFEQPLKESQERLFEQEIQPQLRPLFRDAYYGVKYVLDEDEDEGEYDFQNRFMSGFEAMVSLFKRAMTPTNFDTLMELIVVQLTAKWKRIVMQTRFNQNGAIQFDKDLRCVINFLSEQCETMPRDEFTHLLQISTLLNFEEPSEIYEYWGLNTGSLNWQLTTEEIKKVLGMRLDFDANEVAKLSL